MLYEMSAGELPFRGGTSFEVTSAILSQPQPRLPGTLPVGLSAVVDRCLEKSPGERYQSGEHVSAALDAVVAGTAVVAPPPRSTGAPMLGSRGRPWAALTLVAVMALVAAAALDLGGVRTRILGGIAAPAPAIRMAVLPFTNLGGEPDQQFLADGMTQEMITHIGRLNPEALRVIGRTSVQRYAQTDTPIDQIGRELEVDFVLEGSVQREADRVRVTAELVHVADQTQVWADTFEQEISGILLVQSQVARGVAGALAVALLPAEQARLAAARAVDPVVYEAYVEGTSLWQTLGPRGFDAAEQRFLLALERDPYFAPAHAGLAIVWAARNQMGLVHWNEAVPRAREAAERSVELDEGSAEAWTALAMVRTWGEWDWDAAQEAWLHALELNPSDANTQAYYAHFLMHRGRDEEGLSHSDLAVELDPGNALYHALRGVVLTSLGRNEEALEAARTAVSINPRMELAYSVMQRVYVIEGRHEEQLADQRMRIARDPERVALFDRALEEGGYEAAQRAIADLLAARYEEARQDPEALRELRAQGRYFMGVSLAERYLDAGDHDRAIHWLQQAYDVRDPNLPYIATPPFDRLREDPRYQALLSYIGIPAPAP
jgi:TolB-like protein/tetratricopeptide (TPR) repeat protein